MSVAHSAVCDMTWYGALPALPRLTMAHYQLGQGLSISMHGVDIIGTCRSTVHITNQYMCQWYTIWFYNEPYRYKLAFSYR